MSNYEPKYTTIEKISAKLRTKLKILPESTNDFLIPKTVLDPDLIYVVLEESESFLDLYLSLVYVMPLQHKHPILQRCVDCLTISDMLEFYFSHQSMGYENSDLSGAGLNNRNMAYNIIKSLTYGLNIMLPQQQNEVSPYTQLVTPLILPKETLLSADKRPNINVAGVFMTGKHSVQDVSELKKTSNPVLINFHPDD